MRLGCWLTVFPERAHPDGRFEFTAQWQPDGLYRYTGRLMSSLNLDDYTHVNTQRRRRWCPTFNLTKIDDIWLWYMTVIWINCGGLIIEIHHQSSWRHHDVIIIMWDHLVTIRSWKYMHWKPDRIDPHTAPFQELSWMGSIDCIINWSLYYCKKKLIHTTVERMVIKLKFLQRESLRVKPEPDTLRWLCVRLFVTTVVFHHR